MPFRKAKSVDIHVSGGEYNVAANLSDCFGMKTGIATAMVKYPIGELIQHAVREAGVTPFYKWFEHDGDPRPSVATVFSDRGMGCPAAGRLLQPLERGGARCSSRGDFDWAGDSQGRRPLSSTPGGIFAALSGDDRRTDPRRHPGREGEQGDRLVRPELPGAKLWAAAGGLSRAHSVLAKIVSNVDALIGNEEDLQKGLGVPGPDVESSSKLDPEKFFGLIDNVVKKFPNIKMVATTLREVHSTNRHDWAAVLWLEESAHVSPTTHLDVIDRIGGGDGFASGLIYGLLTGRSPEEALRLGWAHGALLTTFPGDVSMAKLDEVEALAHGGSARVQR